MAIISECTFTDFELLGNRADYTMEGSPLKKSINETQEIELKYWQNSFGIEFGVIDYFDNQDMEYFYKLEGHNNKWVKNGTNRQAIFSNLSPGAYKLMVKLSDPLGNPIKISRKIQIYIQPPFWKTVWFKFIVISFVFSFLYMIYRFRINIYKERESMLENKIEVRTKQLNQSNEELLSTNDLLKEQKNIAESQRDQLKMMVKQVEELSQSKINFFTNISHELLTPLTLIIGPSEQLLKIPLEKSSVKQYRKAFSQVITSAKRLFKLVNQLLEFQKTETDVLDIKLQKNDIVFFIDDLVRSLKNSAKQNGVKLKFNSSVKEYTLAFDFDKIEKILFNLIGNSLKFSTSGDKIDVLLDIHSEGQKGNIKIVVSDTGGGIPEKELPKIFERFYSFEQGKSNAAGFGIGLSFVKKLVDFLNGSIKVSSKQGEGTRFDIEIPYDLDADIEENNESGYYIQQTSETDIGQFNDEIVELKEEKLENEISGKDKNTVLVVEDNPGVRGFIVHTLENNYNVLSANNGKQALKILNNKDVRLIVSDVMMPEMDGMELCREVKGNVLTSHIPLIMLTAKRLVENKIEGYQTGADDYLTKPFSAELLLSRIENIIKSRQTLKEKFKNEFLTNPIPIESTSLDEDFLIKLNNLLEKGFSNPDLSVEDLSQEMAMSRFQFFRKLKAIIGMTPKEYLYIFRLKKAAILLSTGKLNVIEVADRSGFRSHSGFTKSFRNYFGVTPSAYSKK